MTPTRAPTSAEAAELLQAPDLAALVKLALLEDEVQEDVTSRALVPAAAEAQGTLTARAQGVAAGLVLLGPRSPLLAAFPTLRPELFAADGDEVSPGRVLARVTGLARELLALERTLLNFLQRMGGIATATASFVAAALGTGAVVSETRKTCPGWRRLDKYAVRRGGGQNHRRSLADQVLIKENHLALSERGGGPAGIRAAVEAARRKAPPGILVEIEVEDLAEFEAALDARPDVIMLDDLSDEDVRVALLRRRERGAAVAIEVSGGLDLARVAGLAGLGVDRFSIGALTHSVRALDLAFKIRPLA
jgi:nicotinate-nucleotide pyrophosphorylase (carboxylating)